MNRPARIRKEDLLLAVSLAVLQVAQATPDAIAAVPSGERGTTMGFVDRPGPSSA